MTSESAVGRNSDERALQIAGYGERIRQERQRLGLTQRDLGLRVGATDSYISHLENELRLPSWDFALALTTVFGFSELQREEFLASIDSARLERARNRSRRRVGGAPPSWEHREASANRQSLDPERIARDLKADPELEAAYRDLLTAFSQPGYREAVIKTLRGLARTAISESPALRSDSGTSDGA